MHPLRYTGQLHEVTLINFSVDPQFLPSLPKGIRPRLFEGRALISMVDVHLRNMQANLWYLPFKFAYHHIAFRLLIHDEAWTEDGNAHGIHFLQSFTDRPFMVRAGNSLTDYKFSLAHIEDLPESMRLELDGKLIHYCLTGQPLEPSNAVLGLQKVLGSIDRAYSEKDGDILVTRIMREQWPLRPRNCSAFRMDFFPGARFEAAFTVPGVIDYTWLPAQKVQVFPREAKQNTPAMALGWAGA